MKTKDTIYKIIILCFVIFVAIAFYNGYLHKKEIENNKAFTVCKYIICREYLKNPESHFKYYVDNKLYKTRYGRCPDNYEEKLNKFFTIKYSKLDPNKIEVDFSKEVTDTTEILNAGFSLVDGKIR